MDEAGEEIQPSGARLGSPILSPEEEPRDLLLDRVYSDSEEEREYQVNGIYCLEVNNGFINLKCWFT